MPAELPVHDVLGTSYSTNLKDDDPPLPVRSYTPADWARNRGEVEIAELLETYEHPEFPRLIAGEAYLRGTLVRYNVEKGFGFIEPEYDESEDALADDEYDDDIFVHVSALYAACAPRGRPARRAFIPRPGQRLAFVVGEGKGGRPQAVRVANARRLSYIEVAYDIMGRKLGQPLDREAATRAWDEYSSRCRAYDRASWEY